MFPFLLPAFGKQLVPIAIAVVVVSGLVTTYLIKDGRAENQRDVAAVQRCNNDKLAQSNAAVIKASGHGADTLKIREAELADAADVIKKLEDELAKVRNGTSKKTPDAGRVCISADDPWLRHWQGYQGKPTAAVPGRP